MTREVLQQALEALEACIDYIAPHTVQGEKDGDTADAAIATIKAALAQPTIGDYAIGYAEGFNDACKPAQPDNTAKLYEELRAIIDSGSESFTHADAVQYLKDNLEPLKWTPEDMAHRPGGLAQPELEPVAYWIPKAEQFCFASPTGRPFAKAWEPLYASPPKRQPLPEERIDDFYQALSQDDRSKQFTVQNWFQAGFATSEAAYGIGDQS